MVLAELGGKIKNALRTMIETDIIDEAALNKLLNSIALALIQADVDVNLVKTLQTNIKKAVNLEEVPAGIDKRKLIRSAVVKELCKLLDPGKQPYALKKGKPNVIMFVGLQGCGKTTSCTKYAYYYKRKGWKTALVCADTYRAGAFDQLKQNATKAKIPFYGSYTERDPVVVAEMGVDQFKNEKYEVIIVDTSGRHKQEAALFEEMQQVAKVVQPDDIVFCMDSSIGQAARDQAQAFKNQVNVGSVIITKLDGHAKGGGALSAVAATQSPIIFVGTGEHIDDFEPFNVKSFVSRLLDMGDISGLLKLLEEEKMFEQPAQQELYKKITEGTGEFTFRDMREQFQSLMKLGPLGKVMSMIPGLGQVLTKGKEQESTERVKRFMTIMDSFTADELDSDGKPFNTQPNRIRRVARGAGVSVHDVTTLLEVFKPFKKLASKMKGLNGRVDFAKMAKGGKMPNLNARQIASMFNPQMIQQLGGMGNLQNMMKKFASGGFPGMPGAGMDFPGL